MLWIRRYFFRIRNPEFWIRIQARRPVNHGLGQIWTLPGYFWRHWIKNIAKLSSVLKIKFFAKILCYNFILQALFQSAQHLYEEGEGSGRGPDLYLWQMDPYPEGPEKNMRIIRIRIPSTAGQYL